MRPAASLHQREARISWHEAKLSGLKASSRVPRTPEAATLAESEPTCWTVALPKTRPEMFKEQRSS